MTEATEMHVDLTAAIDAADEAYDLLEKLQSVNLVVNATGVSVSKRREILAERARVKAELSYASHLLDKARVLTDDVHQKITRLAKQAEHAEAS